MYLYWKLKGKIGKKDNMKYDCFSNQISFNFLITKLEKAQCAPDVKSVNSLFNISDVDPDPVGSVFIWVRGSGSRAVK